MNDHAGKRFAILNFIFKRGDSLEMNLNFVARVCQVLFIYGYFWFFPWTYANENDAQFLVDGHNGEWRMKLFLEQGKGSLFVDYIGSLYNWLRKSLL